MGRPEYGLIGWVYKGRVTAALTKAETNSIGLCVELITRAWETRRYTPPKPEEISRH